MKTALLSFCAILLASTTTAQMKEGTIVYERKINMHRRMPPQDERMKNIIPEFFTDKSELSFTTNESLSKALIKEQDVREHVGEQHDAVFMSAGSGISDEVYKNYTTGKWVESRELGPKKYLVEDSIENFHWKIDGATKKILGFDCKKAVSKNKMGENIIAWYTEGISCPSGPEAYGGLPGMILELSINEGDVVYTAIDLAVKSKLTVKAPNKGKKMNKKEFEKIVATEFGGPPPGGAAPIRIAF